MVCLHMLKWTLYLLAYFLGPILLCTSYDSSSASVSQRYERRTFRSDLAHAEPSLREQVSQQQRPLVHRQ